MVRPTLNALHCGSLGPWILLLTLAMVCPRPVGAQGIWPERARNLEVLPDDLGPDRLRSVMQGFTRSLGVRCAYCHVGEEGQPLSTYDFASDSSRNKDVARRMLRMLGEINETLAGIEPSGPDRVDVWCHTCHAGKPRPMTLEETLTEVRRAEGGEAAIARYRALREEFYGGNQYDFRAPNIEAIAGRTLEAGDTTTAVALLELNTEHFPGRADGFERLGDVARLQGRTQEAIRYYERVLRLDPEHPRAREKLARVRGG
ncbi:MAG: c-type cytochrome [Gemmatimonadota bacterium]